MRYKLDSTEYPRTFEKYPTPSLIYQPACLCFSLESQPMGSIWLTKVRFGSLNRCGMQNKEIIEVLQKYAPGRAYWIIII